MLSVMSGLTIREYRFLAMPSVMSDLPEALPKNREHRSEAILSEEFDA